LIEFTSIRGGAKMKRAVKNLTLVFGLMLLGLAAAQAA
jgi:hypothetical protein